MSERRRSDVVVVGAGLAGLKAALDLEAGGACVEVVEAAGRVGGRVHSMRRLGHPIEAGGTYIGAGYRRVIAHGRALRRRAGRRHPPSSSSSASRRSCSTGS